jgi:hypothetical protein
MTVTPLGDIPDECVVFDRHETARYLRLGLSTVAELTARRELRSLKVGRRGHGEGSIYRDGDYWVLTVELGRDANGHRQRRKVKARTKGEVMRKAKALQEEVRAAVGPDGGALSLTTKLPHSG